MTPTPTPTPTMQAGMLMLMFDVAADDMMVPTTCHW
jgi:hypothetical protein